MAGMDEDLQARYDDAMFCFSQEEYSTATAELEAILGIDPEFFDARLSLGMAYCRLGDFEKAITEGHKAEKLKPNEQLVHTNLSLFYVRAGDKEKAEHHGLQARIASWKGNMAPPSAKPDDESSELEMKPPPAQPYRTPEKFPDMPWKKAKD